MVSTRARSTRAAAVSCRAMASSSRGTAWAASKRVTAMRAAAISIAAAVSTSPPSRACEATASGSAPRRPTRARAASRWMNAVRAAPTVEARASRTSVWPKANPGPSSTRKRRRTPSSRCPSSWLGAAPVTAASTSRSTSRPMTAAVRKVVPASPARAQRSSTVLRMLWGSSVVPFAPAGSQAASSVRSSALPPLRASSSSARSGPTMALAASRSSGSSASVCVAPGSLRSSSSRALTTMSSGASPIWAGACDSQRSVAGSARCASSTSSTTGWRNAARRTARVSRAVQDALTRVGFGQGGRRRRCLRGQSQQGPEHGCIRSEEGVGRIGSRRLRQRRHEVEHGLEGEGLAELVARHGGDAHGEPDQARRPGPQEPGLADAGLSLHDAEDAAAP